MIKKILLLILLLLLTLPSNCFATNWCNDANIYSCLTLETGSGTTAEDQSSNNNDFTFKGSGEPAWSSTVPESGDNFEGTSTYSTDYDGSDDYIGISDVQIASSNEMTVACWVRVANKDTEETVFHHQNSDGDESMVLQTSDEGSGRIAVIDYNGDDFIAAPKWANNTWSHIAVAIDPSYTDGKGFHGKVYGDGVEIENKYGDAGYVNEAKNPSGNETRFGAYGNGTYALDGYIDEAIIFSAVKDATDINEIMIGGLVGESPEVNWCDDSNAQGCWVMEVDEDPITDSSGNGNTGALKGAGEPNFATTSPPAAYSIGYYDWDGSDDYINVSGLSGTGSNLNSDFTLVTWIERDGVGTEDVIFSKAQSSWTNDDKQFFVSTANKLRFSENALGGVESTGTINTEWHHTAVVFDDSETDLWLYIDGVQDGSSTSFNLSNDHPDTFWRLGYHPDRVLPGNLDEFGYFNRTLDSTDINSIMIWGLDQSVVAAGTFIPKVMIF